MEILSGSCRLGLWHVHVYWSGNTIHRVRFATTGIDGDVPTPVRQFCAGRAVNLRSFASVAIHDDTPYSRIYRAVQEIPYGKTATYGEIARQVSTSPRVVGQAMARNATPLVIPCHRVVAAGGIGGFSPAIEIKQLLLDMERKGVRKGRISPRVNYYIQEIQ
ncbi:MAG: MGMT family protein [Methanoregula sp.]|jgi:methylated-DNA-[protein]-cysteine S-methyltransferase|uniref:methylated-DNA--[protein]-cysteine S-methyltransferase n=1 Tax=Methanoregula sp. TaxID=2052170 RepID=UPI0025EF7244|nr:MGMT family protein [Methanoregula sp.]MCK9632860.1 MGMT family protein [Methanoregula sp.]